MREVEAIIDNLKDSLGIKNNAELADLMGVPPTTLSGWINRNAIGTALEKIVEFINTKKLDISIDALLKTKLSDTFNFGGTNNQQIGKSQGHINMSNSPTASKSPLAEEFEKIEKLAHMTNKVDYLKNELEKIKEEIKKEL